MKNIIRKILFTFCLTVIFLFSQKPVLAASPQKTDDLTIDYKGVAPENRIFNVSNFAPGNSATHEIDFKNNGKNTITVSVAGVREGPSGQADPKLETTLDLQIYQDKNNIYSQKLSKLFSEKSNSGNIKLFTLTKGQTKTLIFKVSLPSSSGNQYQKKSVVFKLVFSDVVGEVKGAEDNRDRFQEFKDRCFSFFRKYFHFR